MAMVDCISSTSIILSSPTPTRTPPPPPQLIHFSPNRNSCLFFHSVSISSPHHSTFCFSTSVRWNRRDDNASTALLGPPRCQLAEGVTSESREWATQDFYALRRDVETTLERVEEIRSSAGLKQLQEELTVLEKAATDTALWDDRTKAQKILHDLTDVKDKIKILAEFKTQV